MASLATAKTRIGVGGASINYTRPFTDKEESEAPVGPKPGTLALVGVGR